MGLYSVRTYLYHQKTSSRKIDKHICECICVHYPQPFVCSAVLKLPCKSAMRGMLMEYHLSSVKVTIELIIADIYPHKPSLWRLPMYDTLIYIYIKITPFFLMVPVLESTPEFITHTKVDKGS